MKKNTKKARRKNNEPVKLFSQPTYQGDNNIPTSIEIIQYDTKQFTVKDITSSSNLKSEINPDKMNWIKIVGISDGDKIWNICREFGLQRFDVRDMLADQRVVKVVVYEDIAFILISGFFLDKENNLTDMQIGFILGDNFLVSFQESALPIFGDVKVNLEANEILIRQGKASYLLYILLRTINNLNASTVMSIEDQLTEMEDCLVTKNQDPDIISTLRKRRVDYTHIKRSITSFREEFYNLLQTENELIDKKGKLYFNDYDDKLRTTLSNLDSFHEALTSLMDLYYNNNNLRMNNIMKQLTIVSTIFIPLSFFAGVWGMNFQSMPELASEYGYIGAWGIFICIIAFVCVMMKRKGWF